MAAKKFDFTGRDGEGSPCEVNATFSYQITWQTQDCTTGIITPIDLTGYAAKMQVRQAISAPLIIEISTANSRIAVGGTNGIMTITIAATDTAPLVPGMYKYDLEVTSPAGFVTRLLRGSFEIIGSINE